MPGSSTTSAQGIQAGMPFPSFFRSASRRAREASIDPAQACIQTSTPEIDCEVYRKFFDEHCEFVQAYQEAGHAVNSLSKLLRSSLKKSCVQASSSSSNQAGPQAASSSSTQAAAPGMSPVRLQTIQECTTVMGVLIDLCEIMIQHVGSASQGVKKDLQKYGPPGPKRFRTMEELEKHMLETILKEQQEQYEQEVAEQKHRKQISQQQRLAQEASQRSGQSGAPRPSPLPPTPPRNADGVVASPRPGNHTEFDGFSNIGQTSPATSSQCSSPTAEPSAHDRGGASRWTNPMRALGGRFPRAQNANARPESRQSAIQAPPPPSADAMNLEPGAGLAQVCRRSYRLDPREAEGPQTLPDFPDVEVDPEDSEDEPFIKR